MKMPLSLIDEQISKMFEPTRESERMSSEDSIKKKFHLQYGPTVLDFTYVNWQKYGTTNQSIEHLTYSRVHISSDTAFLKILKKPSIVQE